MTPETEQELTHVLLIELLAYQFTYPVRWIQTQDRILGQCQAERIIEVGPGNTLINMAKKTHESRFAHSDQAQGIKRSFLGCVKDMDAVYYSHKVEGEGHTSVNGVSEEANSRCHPAVDTAQQPSAAAVAEISTQTSQASQTSHAEPTPQAVRILDSPTSAIEVLTVLLARKFKRPASEIPPSSTIKALAGGRSSLENEIIGDLNEEFGGLPDRSEDVPVQELGEVLQAGFAGRLGKPSSTLVERMIGTIMPAGITFATARTYLDRRWGLGAGRQDGVLLLAVSMQPSERLPSTQAAYDFLDGVVKKYAASYNLVLSDGPSNNTTGASLAVIEPHVLNTLMQGHQEVATEILGVLARYTNLDLNESDKCLSEMKVKLTFMQNELDIWNQEHEEPYSSGIQSMFSPLKAREYNSSWSWAVQDIRILLEDISNRRLCFDISQVEEHFTHILSRTTPRVIECITYMVDKQAGKPWWARDLIGMILSMCRKALAEDPVSNSFTAVTAPCTTINEKGEVSYTEIKRDVDFALFGKDGLAPHPNSAPKPQIKRQVKGQWKLCKPSTRLYSDVIHRARSHGLSFCNKSVLITGAGHGSIGAELLKALLNGGARVIVTTSSFSSTTTANYQQIYARYSARGSRLIVVPFNQGSKKDVEVLVSYIFTPGEKGLGWDLDHVIPLAAISENGRELDQIDSKSELAHRIMLTNTLRLLGAIKTWKERRGFVNRPTQILLPLSPNHGTFGGDGLYSESKLSLETLFNRWHSESWADYLSVMGMVIGWTRGTGLMASNDKIASLVELDAGIRTFSVEEMALNILGLMASPVSGLCQVEPICADLSGGLNEVDNLKEITARCRSILEEEQSIKRSLFEETLADTAAKGKSMPPVTALVEPRPLSMFEFPKLPNYQTDMTPLSELRDMLDLERVVVITGFAEVGPYGNARTRWDIEANGDFSPQGYAELAWIMGLIRNQNTTPANIKSPYSGWVDAETAMPVAENDIKTKYGKFIHEHCGIRPIERELARGYDPKRKQFLHEVVLQNDLPPMEVSQAVANEFKREHGDMVEISPSKSDSQQFLARFKKGAVLMIPKAQEFNRTVAGQVPLGWDARRYGIPDDIANQVDRSTLYTLVCIAEALISCGVTDPYEFYQHIHVSEIGNCIGSGFGGTSSLSKIHRDRFLDKSLPADTLQETFINTTAAWINMLFFSSSGPIRTPVGACATSLESLDIGYDTIVSGKAKMCLVGGFDDFSEEVSYEFGMMGATLNSDKDYQRGRTPKEMSRPATTSRSGFVEAHGSGVQILTSARLALDMGLPIYGVVALTGTASDKIGRSVAAPGKGVATYARESQLGPPSPLLNIAYRRRRLDLRMKQIQELEDSSIACFQGSEKPDHSSAQECIKAENEGSAELPCDLDTDTQAYIDQVRTECHWQRKEARYTVGGNAFYHNDPQISPIRGALAVWGLTIDDLAFASFHGTSTQLNDTNESAVLQAQMSQLGRSKGNPLWGVFQKYLTGHPKGAAGAWMLNGCLQAMNDKLIPGNRNADNIDATLEQYHHIVYPNRSIRMDVKAFTVTSFGFGQKGAQAIGVHPKYLFAVLGEDEYDAYALRREQRERHAKRRFYEGIVGNSVVRVKDHAPYEAGKQEMQVLLDGGKRLNSDWEWN